MLAESFFTFKAGDVVVSVGIVLAYLSFRMERKNAQDERQQIREDIIEEQTKMHTENRTKIESLLIGQREQQTLNRKRDEQITELKTQTATIAQIARGIDRRLELLEDK